METLLILLLIMAVTAAFLWARRALGDGWPPVREPAAMPPATAVTPEAPGAPDPVMPLPAEVPRAESPAAIAAPAPDATREELPPPAPHIVQPPAGIALSQAFRAMIVSGGALALPAFAVSRLLPAGERLPAYALFSVGVISALAGGRWLMRGSLPVWIGSLLARLALWLSVSPAQAVLLLMSPAYAALARLAAGDGLLSRQPVIAVLAWLAAIGFVVAGSVDREDRRPLAIGRKDLLLSLVLFAAALALRAYRTAEFPNTFSGDEGSAGLFAVEFLSGRVNNPLTLGWFSFPSLYFAVQSAAIALFGQTIEAVRLTSAVAGALTVVALYWLGRAMFGRATALLAAGYLAASHYHIHMSRIALNNVWDGLFATVAILGLWVGWRSGRRIGFILCGLALGLGQYFYVSIRVVPVLFLIWAAFAFWRQRALFRERFAGLVLAAFIALVVFLPLGMRFYHHPDEFQAPMNRVTIFGSWLEAELAKGERTTAGIILDQAVTGALGFTHEPLRLLYAPGSPLLLTLAALLFLTGIVWALLNFDLRYLLIMLPLLATLAANAISQDPPASQRFITAIPMVALFMAVPLTEMPARLRTGEPRLRKVALAGAFGLMALVAIIDLNYYFNRAFDTYVFGGRNTLVATEVAYFLRDKEPADQQVYFFGFPRMGYFSLSTIPFLAPQKRAQDIIEPLTGPPALTPDAPALFIFLPERLSELALVQQRFPGGETREFRGPQEELLFVVYETTGQ